MMKLFHTATDDDIKKGKTTNRGAVIRRPMEDTIKSIDFLQNWAIV